MIKMQKKKMVSLSFKSPAETFIFSLYKENDHRKVFNKIVDKHLDFSDFPVEKIVYKKWLNRHFYQINNNILITVFEGVDDHNLGQLISADLKIKPSKTLPKTYDMINQQTKFCGNKISFNLEKLDEDIIHCKNTIERLKKENQCDECVESHERLLEYMLFCKEKLGG